MSFTLSLSVFHSPPLSPTTTCDYNFAIHMATTTTTPTHNEEEEERKTFPDLLLYKLSYVLAPFHI